MFIRPTDKIGLIGLNGRGKSTLLKIITGDLSVNAGSISKSKECTVGFLNQDLLSYQTDDAILTVAMGAFKAVDTQRQIEKILHQLETEYSDDLVDKLTRLQENFCSIWTDTPCRPKRKRFLEGIGFSTQDLHRPLRALFRGMAHARNAREASTPRKALTCLMLDEPTNHLDLPSIEWVENYLRN